MSEIVFLYVTAPNAETAARIARALIEENLAACVNIHAEMRSVYEWEGKVEIGLETPLIVKTTAAAANAARDRIGKSTKVKPNSWHALRSKIYDPQVGRAPRKLSTVLKPIRLAQARRAGDGWAPRIKSASTQE